MARLLGHRAPKEPLQPALLHLLAASPLHGRVYVPPPPPPSSVTPSRDEGRHEGMDEDLDESMHEAMDDDLDERQHKQRGDHQRGGSEDRKQQGAAAGILPLFPKLISRGVAKTWSSAIAAQMAFTAVQGVPGVRSETSATSNAAAKKQAAAKPVSEFATAGLSAAAIAVMEKLTPKLRDAAKQVLTRRLSVEIHLSVIFFSSVKCPCMFPFFVQSLSLSILSFLVSHLLLSLVRPS